MSVDEMLTVKTVATRLGTTERTIQRWVKAGKFPGVFIINPDARRSQVLIPVADVEALERERAGPGDGRK